MRISYAFFLCGKNTWAQFRKQRMFIWRGISCQSDGFSLQAFLFSTVRESERARRWKLFSAFLFWSAESKSEKQKRQPNKWFIHLKWNNLLAFVLGFLFYYYFFCLWILNTNWLKSQQKEKQWERFFFRLNAKLINSELADWKLLLFFVLFSAFCSFFASAFYIIYSRRDKEWCSISKYCAAWHRLVCCWVLLPPLHTQTVWIT